MIELLSVNFNLNQNVSIKFCMVLKYVCQVQWWSENCLASSIASKKCLSSEMLSENVSVKYKSTLASCLSTFNISINMSVKLIWCSFVSVKLKPWSKMSVNICGSYHLSVNWHGSYRSADKACFWGFCQVTYPKIFVCHFHYPLKGVCQISYRHVCQVASQKFCQVASTRFCQVAISRFHIHSYKVNIGYCM